MPVDHPDVLNGGEGVWVILLGSERSWPGSLLGTIMKRNENLGGGPALSGEACDSRGQAGEACSMIVSAGAFTVATCILSAPALKRYGLGGTRAADETEGGAYSGGRAYPRVFLDLAHIGIITIPPR